MKRTQPHHFLRGLTPLSLLTILMGLAAIGFMIQVGNVRAGASFMIGGLFALPIRPVMFIVPLVLISGLLFCLKRKHLYTRAELVCILFALLLAPPLLTEGFWSYVVRAAVAIPQTSDMTKLDAYSDKMWPHGKNIVEGALTKAPNHNALGTRGNLTWETLEVDAGQIVSVPVLRNNRPQDVSTIRIPVPLFKADALHLYPDEPYLLTLLAKAEGLEAESYYYCRVYYDDREDFATEVFSSREEASPGYLHPAGFLRKGRYGVEFDAEVERAAYIELGLVGRGRVAFADLSLMNVSVIAELKEGRKVLTQAQYDALPAKLRGRVLVRPDSMFSLAGLRLILSGGIPLREWLAPALFWFGYVVLLLGGTFAVAVIMRRQWVENERYPLPVAQIPIRLLGLESDDASSSAGCALPPIWTNRLMWVGFSVTLWWCVMKIWAAYNTSVPNLSINVPLSPYFSDPAWGGMWNNVNFKVCSIFLALGLFMELNVLISIVLGFFLFSAQYWFGHTYGLSSTAGYPFTSDQMNGSYLMYAIVVLVLTRKYLWAVLKRAARGGCGGGEEREAMSYRACLATLVLCYVGVGAWAHWAGLGVVGMLCFYTIMLLVSFVAAKLRAECGVPFSTHFPWGIVAIVPLLGNTPLFVPAGFLFIAIASQLLVVRSFLLLPGLQFELIELGRRAHVVPRHLVAVCVLGVMGALVVGGWFTLSDSYNGGTDGTGGYATTWFSHYGNYLDAVDKDAATTALPAVETVERAGGGIRPQTWAVFYGAATVTAVTVLRQFFAGFWFHPIGILVGPSWMAQEAWGSLLLACLIRLGVLKLGGAATVRDKMMPFAVGVFLGGTAAYFIYVVTVSYLKFFVPGTQSVWWSLWAL